MLVKAPPPKRNLKNSIVIAIAHLLVITAALIACQFVGPVWVLLPLTLVLFAWAFA